MAVHKNKELFKNSPGPLAENFPPSKLPKFICQPKLFLNKLVLWQSTCPSQIGVLMAKITEQKTQNSLHNEDSYCIQNLNITGWD